MEVDFRSILAGDTSIAALVNNRIYPGTYAQAKAGPAIRYQKITGSTGLHMQGSDGLSQALMQVDVRAETAASVLAVRDALVSKLHGFSGTVGETEFQLIALRDDRGVRFETTETKSYYTTSLDWDVTSSPAG